MFVGFIDRTRSLVGMVIPVFAEASDFRAWPTWVRALVTVIVLAVILTGLYFLNQLSFVQDHLTKYAPDKIKTVYLPILFLLLCALSWIAYFWWKLFNASDAAEHPDPGRPGAEVGGLGEDGDDHPDEAADAVDEPDEEVDEGLHGGPRGA